MNRPRYHRFVPVARSATHGMDHIRRELIGTVTAQRDSDKLSCMGAKQIGREKRRIGNRFIEPCCEIRQNLQRLLHAQRLNFVLRADMRSDLCAKRVSSNDDSSKPIENAFIFSLPAWFIATQL